jgi:hypothetical protein
MEARMAWTAGDIPAAAQVLERAASIVAALDSPALEADLAHTEAPVVAAAGDAARALEILEACADLHDDLGEDVHAAIARTERPIFLLLLGRDAEASAEMSSALIRVEQLEIHRDVFGRYAEHALLLQAERRWADAVRAIDRGSARAEGFELPWVRGMAEATRAVSAARLGDFDSADDAMARAALLLDAPEVAFARAYADLSRARIARAKGGTARIGKAVRAVPHHWVQVASLLLDRELLD